LKKRIEAKAAASPLPKFVDQKQLMKEKAMAQQEILDDEKFFVD
jgi:hypothetical protein